MTLLRHDRILGLKDLHAYPSSDTLDLTLWLPPSEDKRRRLWVLAPTSRPEVCIDLVACAPQREAPGAPRWLDYGVVQVPTGFSQLRIKGLPVGESRQSYLVISSQLDITFDGDALEEVERKLWGLARADAGSTMLSPCRVTVGSPVELTVCYSAGPRGLPAGALVRFSLPKLFDLPQIAEPGQPGYVRVLADDAPVRVVRVEPSVESHEKVDILCQVDAPLAPGAGFRLSYYTSRTYLFPNLFYLTDRRYWYSKLPPLQAAVALSEDRPCVALADGNGHTLQFVAGPAERLHLFLPGRRFVGEELALRGLSTDHYRNVPPEGAIDADFELYLIGEGQPIPLGTPAGHFTARHRFAISLPRLAPGVYRAVACRPGSDQVLARSNPLELVAPASDVPRVYWGEIHGHSEQSDGSGSFAGMYSYAREEGCLDFAAGADHACYFSDNEWLWMQDVTNAANEEGRFVALNGYEWAGKQVHRNVYTSRDQLALFRGMYEPTSRLDAVWQHFHGDPEVVGGPHGGLSHGLRWEYHDPDVERFLEIYSMWGANDRRENPLIPDFVRENPRGMTANEVLLSGARLGFTGGGDCHEAHPGFSCEDPEGQGTAPHTFAAILFYRCGLTAAELPELERKALVAALRERHTYATTGARILLRWEVAGLPMGGVGTAAEATCRATVYAVEPLEAVEIIKDGQVAWRMEYNGVQVLDAVCEWVDSAPPAKEHYYYLHVIQRDGQQAWSSPIWVSPVTD